MDRAERRRNERWVNNLSVDKQVYIGTLIEEGIVNNDNLIASILDKCFMSALDDNVDIEALDIKKIIAESNTYMVEYKEYLDKEGSEGLDMIENVELRENVKIKIKQYMDGKMEKNKALKLLKKEFNVPNAELSDLWIACKDRCDEKTKNFIENGGVTPKENITDLEKEKFMEEIGKKNEEILCKEIVVDLEKTLPKLKIVNVVTEVQGVYGTYLKSSTGVRIGDKNYDDISMVEKEKNVIGDELKSKIDGIKQQIEELNITLKETEDHGKNELDKYVELEAVFNL